MFASSTPGFGLGGPDDGMSSFWMLLRAALSCNPRPSFVFGWPKTIA